MDAIWKVLVSKNRKLEIASYFLNKNVFYLKNEREFRKNAISQLCGYPYGYKIEKIRRIICKYLLQKRSI